MRRKTYTAIEEEKQPRAAAYLAIVTGTTLDHTLHELRQLEAEGQAKHEADEAGVIRWSLVPAETGAAMELGAEVWMAGHYEPTAEQHRSLGF